MRQSVVFSILSPRTPLLRWACAALLASGALPLSAQQDADVRLTPSYDLGSRAMQEYGVSNTAPLIIRSSPPPAQQSLKFESKPMINVGQPARGADCPADGECVLDKTGAVKQEVHPDDRSRSEFQSFIYKTTGRDLNVFGRSLFENAPNSFTVIDRGIVPDDYVVGPGDEIVFRGWGQVDIDFRGGVVDTAGKIYVPHIGTLPVAGLTLGEVKQRLRAAIGRYYKQFELDVGLGQLRSVQIHVTGFANRPGSYTVQGLSTAVNAIFASGGPSEAGSMRKVELRRAGKTLATVDLYQLVSSGKLPESVRLRNGDVLHFPPLGAQVGMMGSVNQNGIFELLPSETLADLLRYAGGLSTTAAGQELALERIVERRARSGQRLSLDAAGLASALSDGDIVRAAPVSPRFENTITVQGHVPEMRRLAWRKDMTVRDVIPSIDVLMSSDFWRQKPSTYRNWITDKDGKTADRSNPDSLTGPRRDNVESDLARGGLRRETLRADDAVFDALPGASGLAQRLAAASSLSPNTIRAPRSVAASVSASQLDIHWDNATIERLDKRTFTTRLINFHLGRALTSAEPADNPALEPGDVITIYSQRDLVVPTTRRTRFVRIEGEVQQAGVYEVAPGETAAQAIARAGGLTQEAWAFGSLLTRESARKLQQFELAANVDRLERELEKSAANRLRESLDGGSAGVADGGSSLLNAQRRLISRLRQMEASGRVVLSTGDSFRNPSNTSTFAFELEDGDRLVVPARATSVTVIGAVNRVNVMLYREGANAADYIAQAGGMTRDAASSEVFVVRADGAVVQPGGWSRNFAVNRGDVIVVPENTDHITNRRMLRDWTTVAYQGFLSIVSLRLLNDILK